MNAKSQEIKTLNQIMNKDDVLTRFRLLQLWTIDVFTQSCNKSGIDVQKLIEALTTENVDESTQIESIYSHLNNVKKSLNDINWKLKQVRQHVKHQAFIDMLLMKILNEQDSEDNSESISGNFIDRLNELEEVIDINNRRIDRLSEMSEATITEIVKSIKLTPGIA